MVTASFKMSEDKKLAVWLLLITIGCEECRICVFGPVVGRSTDELEIIGIEPVCEKNCCDGSDPDSRYHTKTLQIRCRDMSPSDRNSGSAP